MVNLKKKSVNRNQIELTIIDKAMEKSEKSEKNEKASVKTYRIYLVTAVACLPATMIGTCFSWSSPIGPKLMAQNTSGSPLSRPISENENGLISSIFLIGALITSISSGVCADKIGRKSVLLLSSIFFILGYIILLMATEVWILVAGRLVVGFGSGFALCIMPVYVGEISTDETRGATVSLMPLLMSFGVCYGYSIGPYVSYKVLQYFCLLVPIIFGVVFSFMPESPYYSVARGHRSTASKAVQFLRGQNAEMVESEIALIEILLTSSKAEAAGKWEIVKTAGSRKALLIALCLTFFQETSGQNAVVFYAQSMFEKASTSLDAAVAPIIVGLGQFVAAGVAPVVVNQFKRKTILLYSAAFMSACLAALGYFFYSQIIFKSTAGITWLPPVALVLYTTAFMLGFGPVPWALLSEMFAPNTKSMAAATSTFVGWLTGFLVALSYPACHAMGTYYVFWLFALFCAVAFFFILFTVVETKGLSFSEIQKKLNGN